jgi:hypothetical protein
VIGIAERDASYGKGVRGRILRRQALTWDGPTALVHKGSRAGRPSAGYQDGDPISFVCKFKGFFRFCIPGAFSWNPRRNWLGYFGWICPFFSNVKPGIQAGQAMIASKKGRRNGSSDTPGGVRFGIPNPPAVASLQVTGLTPTVQGT